MRLLKKSVVYLCVISMINAIFFVPVGLADVKYDGVIIQDFDNRDLSCDWWILSNTVETLTTSNKQAHSGSKSMRYEINCEGKSEREIVSRMYDSGGYIIKNPSSYKYIGIWAYGFAQNLRVQLTLWVDGNSSLTGYRDINFEGWNYLEWNLPESVSDDVKIYSIIVCRPDSSYGNYAEIYFDDITVSNVSYEDTVTDDSIAGMYGFGEKGTGSEGAVTLAEAEVPYVTRKSPQTLQLGNENAFQQISYSESKKLPDSISGVSLGDVSTTVRYYNEKSRGVAWAAGWLNDGEFTYMHTGATSYSSGLHTGTSVNEWAMLQFPKPYNINKICLWPRSEGKAFPVDYTVEVSENGEDWQTVITEIGKTFKDEEKKVDMDPVVYNIDPVNCLYLRVHATKIKSDGGGYYFQLREIEAFDETGENVALYTNGTIPSGSNPLSTNEIFDFDSWFSDITDCGIKWLNIENRNSLENYHDGIEPVSDNELNNIKRLVDNKIGITYRLRQNIGEISDEEAEKLGDELSEAITPIVTKLKDYVHYWQVSNEENLLGTMYTPQRPKCYSIVVGKVADRIHKIDPMAKVAVEVALIDFGWTKQIMENGLADKIDVVDYHTYKELAGYENLIEENGTWPKDGLRMWPDTHPYKDYADEILNFKKLIKEYNPNIDLWCTEVAINVGSEVTCVNELTQAKYLARTYIYHQMLGVGPTCWWTLNYVRTGDSEWGIIDAHNQRRDSWYALRNVANTMNNDWVETDTVTAEFSNPEKLISKVYKNGDSYQIPYWVNTKIRTKNTGRIEDITIKGIDVKNVAAIDMITGVVQAINFEASEDGVVLKNMIAHDYPVVIRINSNEKYSEYAAEETDERREKELWEKVIDSSNIFKVGNAKVLSKGSEVQIDSENNAVVPYIEYDRTFLPARFLTEVLNKNIYWFDGYIVISDSKYEIDENIMKKIIEQYENSGEEKENE